MPRRKDHHVSDISYQRSQQYVEPSFSQLTLAQRFGLMKRPRHGLTMEEWENVHQQSIERKDALHGCSICHENFLMGDQLLLSCSHIFHKQCLRRFEKFSRRRCCPICRTEHYQTMAVKIPSSVYKNFSATRIQAAYRAYKCRCSYAKYKWAHPPDDPVRRKEWFAKKLELATNRLFDQRAVYEDNVNTLFAYIDSTLAASKRIYDVLGSKDEQLLGLSQLKNDVDWQLVIEKAIERYDTDCSICIMPLQKDGGANLALLSCSHVFHDQCIFQFESFQEHPSAELLCPICRSMYKRLNL